MKIFFASCSLAERIRMDGKTAWQKQWERKKAPQRRLFSYADIIYGTFYAGTVFNQTLRRIDNAG